MSNSVAINFNDSLTEFAGSSITTEKSLPVMMSEVKSSFEALAS